VIKFCFPLTTSEGNEVFIETNESVTKPRNCTILYSLEHATITCTYYCYVMSIPQTTAGLFDHEKQ